MIKIERPKKPKYLLDRESEWTNNLLDAVEKYGEYKNIPDGEKEKLIKYYRNDNIRTPLFKLAYDKCAFCESMPSDGGSSVQVEHFFPKSIYPEECFSWENFLPACSRCNTSKSDFDTKKVKIINPYFDNPNENFIVSFLKIKGVTPAATATINLVSLNSRRLIRSRISILSTIENLTEDVLYKIKEYNLAPTKRKKANRKNELEDLVIELDDLMLSKNSHSFFCSQVILNDEDYLTAKEILAVYD